MLHENLDIREKSARRYGPAPESSKKVTMDENLYILLLRTSHARARDTQKS